MVTKKEEVESLNCDFIALSHFIMNHLKWLIFFLSLSSIFLKCILMKINKDKDLLRDHKKKRISQF